MIVTNKTGLPEFLYKVIEEAINGYYYDFKPDDTQFSATEILESPAYVWLKRRHEHEAERDAITGLYSLQGSVMHELMKRAGGDALEEIRLSHVVNGRASVSGKFDRFDGDLWDYKYTTVWSHVYESKKDHWEKQLSVYAFLLKRAGFPVKGKHIIEMFRDWSPTAVISGKYNMKPIEILDFSCMSEQDTEKFINERVEEILEYKDVRDGDLPPCSEENRWTTERKFAVMKHGNKTAKRVLNSWVEAKDWIARQKDSGNLYIEDRPGTDKRCQDVYIDHNGVSINYGYCPYNVFCPFYKSSVK